jgi:hypothetical protein
MFGSDKPTTEYNTTSLTSVLFATRALAETERIVFGHSSPCKLQNSKTFCLSLINQMIGSTPSTKISQVQNSNWESASISDLWLVFTVIQRGCLFTHLGWKDLPQGFEGLSSSCEYDSWRVRTWKASCLQECFL